MPDEYGIVFSSFEQFINEKKTLSVYITLWGYFRRITLLEKIHSPSSVLMIKEKVIDEIGLWDEDFRRHQDWEFVTRVLVKYKACSISKMTVKRIVTWRNNAKDPELFEEQRMFFLKKMNPIIRQQDISIQKKIIIHI